MTEHVVINVGMGRCGDWMVVKRAHVPFLYYKHLRSFMREYAIF